MRFAGYLSSERERNAQVYTHQTHYRFETRGAGYYSLTLQKDTAKQVLQNIQPYWLIKVIAIPDYLRAQFRGLDIDPKEFLCVSPINGKKHNVMSVLEEKSLSSHIL